MRKIIEVVNNFVALSNEECKQLEDLLETVQLDKGDYWIREGNKNHHVAFIEQGYLRKFYVKDGKEITDFFYFENEFSVDLPSILENRTPDANIMAMQKTSLTTFSYYHFNELCKQSLTFEHLHRLLIQFTFLRFYKRTTSFILKTPKERYDDLIASYPDVFQRSAQYHIASYLGISPQHLSRIRGQK